MYFQLSYNAYADRIPERTAGDLFERELGFSPYLRWDQRLWEDATRQIAGVGGNQIVLSIGDGIRYDSHPELAVDGAWTPAELRSEIARLRGLGLDVVPELNFSTTHDIWLKPYDRMVSTSRYYEVCADLIAEVIDLFDGPPYVHLGFDEETLEQQRSYDYVVLRQHDLWWRDLLWFIDQVESRGVRPWVWADAVWNHAEQFLQRMPKSVVQSNWYYGESFDLERVRARFAEHGVNLDEPPGAKRSNTSELFAYLDLATGPYDQILTGSSFLHDSNFPDTVRFAQRYLPAPRVLGFLQTTWRPMLEPYRDRIERGIEAFAEGKRVFDPEGWAASSQ